LPEWEPLPDDQKELYARQMEVYAGFQENADWNLGRIIDAITEMGELDNTVVICKWGDNGASMEGTTTGSFNELTMQNGIPLSADQQLALTEAHGGLPAWGTEKMEPHYACAWAWAGNTPFQWGKQVACYLGGTRVGMVVHWPGQISDAGLRPQFTHCIDIAPTILDIVGLPQATSVNGIAQEPMQGTSFAYTFDDPDAAEQHTRQYFEIYGNLGMYDDGWWAAQMLPRVPWDATPATMERFRPGVYNPDNYPWELYYLPDDYSQATDLATQHPEKLKELKELFFRVAEENYVTPLLAGFATYFGIEPPPVDERTLFTYYHDVQNILPGSIPPIFGRSYTISAELEIPEEGAQGVIIAEGAALGGFSLFVQEGRLRHTYSMLGVRTYHQQADQLLPKGQVVNVRMEFTAARHEPGTPGIARLFQDDVQVSKMLLHATVPVVFTAYAGMDIGRDNGLPVDESYAAQSPFPFTGAIRKVEIELPPIPDHPIARRLYQRHSEQLVAWAISE